MAADYTFLGLPAGNVESVAAVWKDALTRNAILDGLASVLPGVASAETITVDHRNKLAEMMNDKISSVETHQGDTLKRVLPVDKLMQMNPRQMSVFPNQVVLQREGQQGVQKFVTALRLCFSDTLSSAHVLGNTMQVDSSVGNVSTGPAASQSGNPLHPCNPQSTVVDVFAFPGEQPASITGAANVDEKKLYIVRANALNRLLQSITDQIVNLIELMLANPANAWLEQYWTTSGSLLQSLAEISEDEMTPMVHMLTKKHKGTFLYRHVLFAKLVTIAVAPHGQSAIRENAESKQSLMQFKIYQGNELSNSSYAKLDGILDLVSRLELVHKQSGDPDPKAHTNQIFQHWYGVICQSNTSWSRHIKAAFWKSATELTLNPDTEDIIMKLRNACAERRKNGSNPFTQAEDQVAGADTAPYRRQESRDSRSRKPPSKVARNESTSTFSKSKKKSSFAPKFERTICKGPCKGGNLIQCIKTPGTYHKQDSELKAKIKAHPDPSDFNKLEGEHSWLKTYARKTLENMANAASHDDSVPMMDNSAVTATYAEQVNYAVGENASHSALHQAQLANSSLLTKGGDVAFNVNMSLTPTDMSRTALEDIEAGDGVDTPSESSDSSSDASVLDDSELVYGISGEEILDRIHAERDAALSKMDVSDDETGSPANSDSNESDTGSTGHGNSEIDEFADLRADDDFIPGDRPELLERIAELESLLANRVAYDADIKEAYDAIAAIKGNGTLCFKGRSFIPEPVPAENGTITVLGGQFVPKHSGKVIPAPVIRADGTILYEDVVYTPPKKKSRGQHHDGSRKRS